AGRGKTTLINAVCTWTRIRHEIALATATSAFAAQLYPGGTTTHSMFKVRIFWCFLSPLLTNSRSPSLTTKRNYWNQTCGLVKDTQTSSSTRPSSSGMKHQWRTKPCSHVLRSPAV
ncbi:hypothetical protein BDN72DRAFT_917494, partial [Pluteus cervinus]